MGSIGLLIVYTLVLGILEIQFDFTVGQIVQNLISLLANGG